MLSAATVWLRNILRSARIGAALAAAERLRAHLGWRECRGGKRDRLLFRV
jgi:hypothetical protein